MCIAGIAPLLSVVGTVVSAGASIAQGRAQAQAAEYNAKQNRLLAEDALKRGEQAKEAKRRSTAALEGRQKAVLAASNVDLGSGSPLAILGDTAQLGELDAAIIGDNAKREKQYYNANADLADMEARSARQAGMFGAFSTVLGGASSLAKQWYKPSSSGALGA